MVASSPLTGLSLQVTYLNSVVMPDDNEEPVEDDDEDDEAEAESESDEASESP